MKKIIIAAVILVLIVGLSYVKTLRDYDRSRAYYQDGKSDAVKELGDYKGEAESLKLAAGQQQVVFADSLVKKDISYQARIDSLEGVVDKQQEQISTLVAKTTSKPEATANTSSPKPTLSKHEEILKYYKKRYANLPKDLSDYEKRIAVNEIREETSLKFSISLQELKKIRDKYKLTY